MKKKYTHKELELINDSLNYIKLIRRMVNTFLRYIVVGRGGYGE